MNDIQKQLDELLARKQTLTSIIDHFRLEDIDKLAESSGPDSVIYQEIARYYRDQRSRAVDTANYARIKINQQMATKSRQKVNRAQQLIKESQRLEVLRQQKLKKSRALLAESRRIDNDCRILDQTRRTLLTENRQLMKDSRKLDKQQNQLIRTSADNLLITNNKILNASINFLWALIKNIDNNINTVSLQLSESIAIAKINELCNSQEYQQEFIKTCLLPDILPDDKHILNLTLLTIRSHCDWHYPGLQINPSSKEWIDCMVTADPLYVVNRPNNDNLSALLDNYPIEYVQRLRVYTVDNDYSILPQGQFGCITCCNFLNLFDLSTIEQLLATFNKLLRPGGKLICNMQFLHNTDDKKYFNYTINLILEKLFNRLGYTILSSNELAVAENISILITAQKFGILTTSKAHQVLGSIIEK
jgi:hypothetical protein